MKIEVNKAALLVLVEGFWEYESGWGSTLAEKQAAWELQQAAGYVTEWDVERAQAATPPLEVHPSVGGSPTRTLKLSGNMLEIPLNSEGEAKHENE